MSAEQNKFEAERYSKKVLSENKSFKAELATERQKYEKLSGNFRALKDRERALDAQVENLAKAVPPSNWPADIPRRMGCWKQGYLLVPWRFVVLQFQMLKVPIKSSRFLLAIFLLILLGRSRKWSSIPAINRHNCEGGFLQIPCFVWEGILKWELLRFYDK